MLPGVLVDVRGPRACSLGWVRRGWDFQLSTIHRLLLLVNPLLPDLWQNGSSVDFDQGVGHWLRRPRLRVEDARIAGVEGGVCERWRACPATQLVIRVLGDIAEDIGAYVIAAESVGVPVSLNGSNLGVVVVEVGVRGADKVLGDGVAEKDREGPVLLGVRAVFVEGNQNHGVLHEVLVVEKRLEESSEPGTSCADGGVMCITGHVWCDEHPLWQLVSLQVLLEHGKILDLGETVCVVGNGVKQDCWAFGL